jgi:hypothetical protein
MPIKVNEIIRAKNPPAAKVLLFDIETTPMKSWHWRMHDENIAPKQVIEFSRVLCYAAKWLGRDAVAFERTNYRAGAKSDRQACRDLWKLFDEADVVVAHNGKAFDTDTLRARWMFYGLQPPAPFKVFDTLRAARGYFRFPSNSLDCIARYLNIGRKVEHEGFDLWLKCMEGDGAAWQRMETYNVGDVLLLEEAYLRLRPWSNLHPNIALRHDGDTRRCVCCGAAALEELAKASYTNASVFPSFRCKKCGKVMRGRKRDKRNGDLMAHSL